MFHHTADGSNIWLHASPLSIAAVFTTLQQVLAPPVVGMLIEEPSTFEHLAGVDITDVPALVEDRHVVCHLHPLTFSLASPKLSASTISPPATK